MCSSPFSLSQFTQPLHLCKQAGLICSSSLLVLSEYSWFCNCPSQKFSLPILYCIFVPSAAPFLLSPPLLFLFTFLSSFSLLAFSHLSPPFPFVPPKLFLPSLYHFFLFLPSPLSFSFPSFYLFLPYSPLFQGAWEIVQPRTFSNVDGNKSYTIPAEFLEEVGITSCEIRGCYQEYGESTVYFTNSLLVTCGIPGQDKHSR